jgi:hypothetical protein
MLGPAVELRLVRASTAVMGEVLSELAQSVLDEPSIVNRQ